MLIRQEYRETLDHITKYYKIGGGGQCWQQSGGLIECSVRPADRPINQAGLMGSG